MARETFVVEYSNKWRSLFNEEKILLQRIFSDTQIKIEHFGSTSVFGMSAKPIIDIMVIVEDISLIDNYKEIMIKNRYTPRGENGIRGRRYFVKFTRDDSGNHSHHVHIYQNGNIHIEDELMFRDYLRVDAESFSLYEQVKITAANKYRANPAEYQNAKSECVSRIMLKAKHYYCKL